MISRNLSNNALAYLAARPGEKFQVKHLAELFNCHATTMRDALKKLVYRQEIKSEMVGSMALYSFEQAPKKAAPVVAEPRQSPITHKSYALPAVLAERGRELAEYRAACPSKHI